MTGTYRIDGTFFSSLRYPCFAYFFYYKSNWASGLAPKVWLKFNLNLFYKYIKH